nr:hypothetical protein [Fredinandcohnia onubensis]
MRQGRQGRISHYVSLIVSRFIYAAIGYGFMYVVTKLLLMSRNDIHRFGMSTKSIIEMNMQINNMYSSFLNKIGKINIQYFMHQFYLEEIGAIFLFVLVSITIFVYLKDTPTNGKGFSLPSSYIYRLSANSLKTTSAYCFKDLRLIVDLSTGKLGLDPLSVLFSFELLFTLGANIPLLPHVHNVYIILFLFFMEIRVMVIGTIRRMAFMFRDVFYFDSDASNSVFLLYSDRNNFSVLNSKYQLLNDISRLPIIISIIPLFIMYSIYYNLLSISLLCDIALMSLLFSSFVKWVLRTDYDVFSIIMKEGNLIPDMPLRDYAGYIVVRNTNNVPTRIITYITFLVALFSAFLQLLSGIDWLWFLIIFFIVFLYKAIEDSKYYSKDKSKFTNKEADV